MTVCGHFFWGGGCCSFEIPWRFVTVTGFWRVWSLKAFTVSPFSISSPTSSQQLLARLVSAYCRVLDWMLAFWFASSFWTFVIPLSLTSGDCLLVFIVCLSFFIFCVILIFRCVWFISEARVVFYCSVGKMLDNPTIGWTHCGFDVRYSSKNVSSKLPNHTRISRIHSSTKICLRSPEIMNRKQAPNCPLVMPTI